MIEIYEDMKNVHTYFSYMSKCMIAVVKKIQKRKLKN